MKIKRMPFLLLPLFSLSMAQYTVIYPVSNITFINGSKWISAEALVSEWVVSDKYYNCSSELPASVSIDKGQEFQQTLSGCSQDKTRTVQEREQNPDTLEYRDVGEAQTETQTDTGLSYSKTSYGTGDNESFTVRYGAGAGFVNPNRFVGAYARSNNGLDLGTKHMNSDNQRVLVYYSSPNANTCRIYMGVSEEAGWTPNTTTNLTTALAFVNKYKYVDIYNADNSLFKRYDFTMAGSIANNDGAYKAMIIPCGEMNPFYSNPSFYSKAVLNTL